jgi:methyl-accepting chemotaxis protein
MPYQPAIVLRSGVDSLSKHDRPFARPGNKNALAMLDIKSLLAPSPEVDTGIGFRRSLAWRMILPIPMVVIAGIVAVWIVVPRAIVSMATDGAVTTGEQIAAQYKIIRKYYTENVVNKIIKDGTFKPSTDHKNDDKAIPLPTTMIHDLSALLSRQNTTLNLYSMYPFPNRRDRKLDTFQQKAWEYLSNNPEGFLSQNEMREGKNVVRVAVADTMATQACVNCHNTVAGSPKTDWKLGDVRGVLEVTTVIDQQLAHGTALSAAIIIGVGLIGLLLIGITLVVTRSITTPINGMVGAMKQLAKGDTGILVPGGGRRDEIGAMAGAVQVFKDTIIDAERLRAEQAEIEKRGAEERKSEMHRLAGEFERAVGYIVNTVSASSNELEAAAATLTRTAETTQVLSTTVAASSEEASAHVQSVASAAQEFSGSAAEIGRQVLESKRIASEAVKQANTTNVRMAELSQSATRIGDVVKLITSVADQTNLLALNATIEAARAGDAGRGFAVVAQEVKALAAQTSKATEEISSQIAAMQTATEGSVIAIREIGDTINRIAEIATTIASTVKEQDAATQEISRNVQQAAVGTMQVASHITDVSSSAQETGSASSRVLSSAQSLSKESQQLKLEVDRFITTIRAT